MGCSAPLQLLELCWVAAAVSQAPTALFEGIVKSVFFSVALTQSASGSQMCQLSKTSCLNIFKQKFRVAL